jgi:hypothetical protein
VLCYAHRPRVRSLSEAALCWFRPPFLLLLVCYPAMFVRDVDFLDLSAGQRVPCAATNTVNVGTSLSSPQHAWSSLLQLPILPCLRADEGWPWWQTNKTLERRCCLVGFASRLHGHGRLRARAAAAARRRRGHLPSGGCSFSCFYTRTSWHGRRSAAALGAYTALGPARCRVLPRCPDSHRHPTAQGRACRNQQRISSGHLCDPRRIKHPGGAFELSKHRCTLISR